MAMDIDPFSMLEVSLQEGPEIDERRSGPNASSGVMHQVVNDVQVIQPPPPLHYFGSDVLTPQRAVLNNIQKLSSTSKDEEKFRRRAYSSISLVLRKRLHCTICDAHIGAYLGLKDMDIEHPLLKVLACPKCTLKYHYLDFPLSLEGRDVRCRWCTNSSKEESPLRYCSYCPFAFCEMCIYRNLPLDELASNKNSWICFVCNVKDLWPSRAVLWALRVLIDTNLALKEEKKWSTDQSTCCKNKVTKPRRVISLPQVPGQPTNGHNVAVRAAVHPNQFRLATPNNYRMPQPGPSAPTIIRPIVRQQTAYRAIRPVVQVVRPVPVPVAAVGTNSQSTQLYDTSWLTEKVSNISTTLLNLNNNLHRLAQGIPEKENKYSIKSKMISMVSLLNISATQLQKASKEMEEESKRILDKNYRVARITPVVNDNKAVASTSKPALLGKRPPPRSRSTSSRRNRRRRRSDTDSDPDDPDFRTKAKLDDGSEDEDKEVVGEDETSRLSTRSYETRACFVKLERLDYKYVAGYDSGSDSCKSEFEPQPSTSFAPEVVPPSDAPEKSDADGGGTEKDAVLQSAVQSGVTEDHTINSTDAGDDAALKVTEGDETSAEMNAAAASKETSDAKAFNATEDSAGSSAGDNNVAFKEIEDAIANVEATKETEDITESVEVSQSDDVGDQTRPNMEADDTKQDKPDDTKQEKPDDTKQDKPDDSHSKEEEQCSADTSSGDTSSGNTSSGDTSSTLDTSGDTSKSDSTETS